jgi:hypothetical protein
VRWITTIVVAGEFKMILATPSPVAGLHGVVVDQDLAEIVLESRGRSGGCGFCGRVKVFGALAICWTPLESGSSRCSRSAMDRRFQPAPRCLADHRAFVHMKELQVLAEMISHWLLPAGAW